MSLLCFDVKEEGSGEHGGWTRKGSDPKSNWESAQILGGPFDPKDCEPSNCTIWIMATFIHIVASAEKLESESRKSRKSQKMSQKCFVYKIWWWLSYYLIIGILLIFGSPWTWACGCSSPHLNALHQKVTFLKRLLCRRSPVMLRQCRCESFFLISLSWISIGWHAPLGAPALRVHGRAITTHEGLELRQRQVCHLAVHWGTLRACVNDLQSGRRRQCGELEVTPDRCSEGFELRSD